MVIPAQSVSVVAKNELGASKVREYFAAITCRSPSSAGLYDQEVRQTLVDDRELPRSGRGRATWALRPDLTAFSVAGLEASHLQRLNDAKGRYYTWYEAMTGISGCTAEQCPYVQNYEGVDDVGNAFKLDGTEEGEFGVQIRGCCPEGWHVANANDWWDMLMAIKSEYAIPDEFRAGQDTPSPAATTGNPRMPLRRPDSTSRAARSRIRATSAHGCAAATAVSLTAVFGIRRI